MTRLALASILTLALIASTTLGCERYTYEDVRDSYNDGFEEGEALGAEQGYDGGRFDGWAFGWEAGFVDGFDVGWWAFGTCFITVFRTTPSLLTIPIPVPEWMFEAMDSCRETYRNWDVVDYENWRQQPR